MTRLLQVVQDETEEHVQEGIALEAAVPEMYLSCVAFAALRLAAPELVVLRLVLFSGEVRGSGVVEW
jgi:hypothetical protein